MDKCNFVANLPVLGAKFTFEVYLFFFNVCIVLEDAGGNVSLTNGIREALKEVKFKRNLTMEQLRNAKIMYRDSEGYMTA